MSGMTQAKRVLYHSGEDYVSTSRCSACNEFFLDGDYRFCPYCAAPFSVQRDDSARVHGQPKWHVRLRDMGVDLDSDRFHEMCARMYAARPDFLVYQVQARVVGEPDPTGVLGRWRTIGSRNSCTDRREALAMFREECKDLFPEWEVRLVLFQHRNTWCSTVRLEPEPLTVVKYYREPVKKNNT